MTIWHFISIFWTLGILAACSIPGQSLPDVEIVSFDKVVHFALFAGLSWVWMRSLSLPLNTKTRWVLSLTILYAIATELYQGLLPFDRTPEFLDMLANTVGTLTGVFIYRFSQHSTS